MNISNKAVYAILNLSKWSAVKHDKLMDKQTAKLHSISEENVRVNKTLGKSDSLEHLRKLHNEARSYHYSVTVIYNDKGERVLPTTLIKEWRAKMTKFKNDADKLASTFILDFPSFVNKAKQTLNGTFKDADYPTNIDKYFGFEFDIATISDGKNFLTDLQDEEIKKIEQDAKQKMEIMANKTIQDVFGRFEKTVNHLHSTISNNDAKFKDSIIGNIESLCKLLPSFNIMDNKELENLNKEIKDKLCGVSPDDLRKDKRMVNKWIKK